MIEIFIIYATAIMVGLWRGRDGADRYVLPVVAALAAANVIALSVIGGSIEPTSAAFVLAILAILVYWNSRNGVFVFDDVMILDALRPLAYRRGKAGTLEELAGLPFVPRTFLYWTYARDLLAEGVDRVEGWHDRNIAYHAANVAIFFGILSGIFSTKAAIAGAVLAAVHPVSTSAVASISGRSSVLCATFYLGSLLLLMLGGWWLAGIAVCAWFGFRTKEEYVAVLPAALALWRLA